VTLDRSETFTPNAPTFHLNNITMKKLFSFAAALAIALPVWADEPETNVINPTETTSEITSEDEPSGFFTSMLNDAIESSMDPQGPGPRRGHGPGPKDEEPHYGRTVTGFASVPKFGGYYIGRYSYSDQDGSHGGAGFNQRLIRFYVDGTIFKDFKYRIQLQCNNASFHMKDVFIEWQKYKAFKIKVGQYKRAFGFENPMNPWDITAGDYSLFTKALTGHDDYVKKAAGASSDSDGGRDQGIQIQGDFGKMKDGHDLIHYQIGLWNGQGINASDADGKKDLIGTLQVQPIKNLFIGFFGWHGNYLYSGDSHSKNRYAFGVKYDNKGWTLRSEWGHGQSDLGKADAWYVIGGMPVNDWWKIAAEYQCYRLGKAWGNAHNMYSFISNFQLHKNLMFQVQYNYNNKRAIDANYNEIWAEFYFRF